MDQHENSQIRAEKATAYLIESAADIAEAKADLVQAEHMLRVTKAIAMKQSDERSAAAQEREAYASPEYRKAIDAVRENTRAYEELRAKREAAKIRIEYWRSLNANQRSAERGYGSAA